MGTGSEIEATNIPIMQKAVRVIYDMSEDSKIREIARLREKALHDEASALKNAMEQGEAIGIAKERAATAERDKNIALQLKALGLTDEQIKGLYPDIK